MEPEDRFDSSETPPASASAGNVGMDGLHQSQNISGADETRVHAGRDRWARPPIVQCYESVCSHGRDVGFHLPPIDERNMCFDYPSVKWPLRSHYRIRHTIRYPRCKRGAFMTMFSLCTYSCPARRMPFFRLSQYVFAVVFASRCR